MGISLIVLLTHYKFLFIDFQKMNNYNEDKPHDFFRWIVRNLSPNGTYVRPFTLNNGKIYGPSNVSGPTYVGASSVIASVN